MTHTSTEQPEALYFADVLDNFYSGISRCDATGAAAALRRLHARVQDLETEKARLIEAYVPKPAPTETYAQASQAQRVPLSDEAKKKLLREWSYSQLTGKGDFLDGVEAAERAHGITQEKQG